MTSTWRMIIRIFVLVLWLLLGVFYYSLYTNSKATCCAQESINSTNAIGHAPPADPEVKHQDSLQENKESESVSMVKETTDDSLTQNFDNQQTNDHLEEVEKQNIKNKDEPEKAIIFFPQNSKTRLTSETLEKYLDDIAERVKDSNEIIELYGHTDKLGTSKENQALGMARAKTIRQLLTQRGVPISQIEVHTKGSDEPIGNNKTREGRSKNRRVELFIK